MKSRQDLVKNRAECRRQSIRLLLALVLALTAWASAQAPPQVPPQVPPQPPPKEPQPTQPPAKEASKPPRKRLMPDLSGFELSDPKQVRKQRAVLAATRGGARPLVLLAPIRGKLYGVSPLFAWFDPGRSGEFELVLSEESGTQIFSRQVSAAEFRLGDAGSRLQPGKTYTWSVRAAPSLAESSASAAFVVVADPERQEIDQELAAIPASDAYDAATARARVLVNHRLWYDAIGAYSDLIQRFPDDARLYEARATIYSQVEVTKPLAAADFARADALQQKEPGQTTKQ